MGRPGHVRVFDREMGERIANFSRIAYCPGVCTHTHSPKFSTGHAACVRNRERERERERERAQNPELDKQRVPGRFRRLNQLN